MDLSLFISDKFNGISSRSRGLIDSIDVDEYCWNNEIPVPWKDSVAVLELGLWSMLSIAPHINTFFLRFGGQTIESRSYCLDILLPIAVSISSTRLYEIERPRFDNFSIIFFCLVCLWIKSPV